MVLAGGRAERPVAELRGLRVGLQTGRQHDDLLTVTLLVGNNLF